MQHIRPPAWRLATAFLIAPGIGALAATAVRYRQLGANDAGDLGLLFGIFVVFGYCISTVIGVPAYFWLRRQLTLSLISCGIVGGIVAVLPFLAEQDNEYKIVAGVAGVVGGSAFWAIAISGKPGGAVA